MYVYVCVFVSSSLYSSFRLIVISVFGDFIARDAFIFLLWSHTSILIYCVLLVWLVCLFAWLLLLLLPLLHWTTYSTCVFMGPIVCAFKVVRTHTRTHILTALFSSSPPYFFGVCFCFDVHDFVSDNQKFYIFLFSYFQYVANCYICICGCAFMFRIHICLFPFCSLPHFYPKI